MAAGTPLSALVEELLALVEAASGGAMLCPVLILDEESKRLRHCAAPRLPDAYNAAIDGIERFHRVRGFGT